VSPAAATPTVAQVLAARGLTVRQGEKRQETTVVSYRAFGGGVTDQGYCGSCVIHATLGVVEYHSAMLSVAATDAASVSPAPARLDLRPWIHCTSFGYETGRSGGRAPNYVLGLRMAEPYPAGTPTERAASLLSTLTSLLGPHLSSPDRLLVYRDFLGNRSHHTYAVEMYEWPFPSDSLDVFTASPFIDDAWFAHSGSPFSFAFGTGWPSPDTGLTWEGRTCESGHDPVYFLTYAYDQQQRRRERHLPSVPLAACPAGEERECGETSTSKQAECKVGREREGEEQLLPGLLSTLTASLDGEGVRAAVTMRTDDHRSAAWSAQLRWLLDTVGPFVASIHTCDAFMDLDELVYADDDPVCDEAVRHGGGHALIVDGYDALGDRVTFWHVRNSFGDGWGEGGFAKIPVGSLYLDEVTLPVVRAADDARSPLWPPVRAADFLVWGGRKRSLDLPGTLNVTSPALQARLDFRAIQVTVTTEGGGGVSVRTVVRTADGTVLEGEAVLVLPGTFTLDLPLPPSARDASSWLSLEIRATPAVAETTTSLLSLDAASLLVDWSASAAYREAGDGTNDGPTPTSLSLSLSTTLAIVGASVCVVATCCVLAGCSLLAASRRRRAAARRPDAASAHFTPPLGRHSRRVSRASSGRLHR
jgi:hypothetical protein